MGEHNQDHRLEHARRLHKKKQSDRDLLQLRKPHKENGHRIATKKEDQRRVGEHEE